MLFADRAVHRPDESDDHGPGVELPEPHDREGHDFQSCRQQSLQTYGTAESRALLGRSADENVNAVRFCNADSLTSYLEDSKPHLTIVTQESALEETCFLGLRLTQGLDLSEVATKFGDGALAVISGIIADSLQSGLMERRGDFVRLTSKGRLLSNEVFEAFLSMVPG